MLRLDRETCNKIAGAMIERYDQLKPNQIINKLEKNNLSFEATAHELTDEIYFSVASCSDQSFSLLLDAIYPHLYAHVGKIWDWYKEESPDDYQNICRIVSERMYEMEEQDEYAIG